MAFSFYIYYRIVPGQQAERVVRLLQARLYEVSGVRGRLLVKREDPALWMEVYENVTSPEDFEQHLQRLLAEARFDRLLAPGNVRKVECFRDEACA